MPRQSPAAQQFPGFPENLRRARKARGMTLQRLGDAVGVTRAAIQYYESGRSYPSSSVLVRLARALSVGVECLMCVEVCIAAPRPRRKPPRTRLERAERRAAAWGTSARRWRAWAQSRAARERAALEALRAVLDTEHGAGPAAYEAARQQARALLEASDA